MARRVQRASDVKSPCGVLTASTHGRIDRPSEASTARKKVRARPSQEQQKTVPDRAVAAIKTHSTLSKKYMITINVCAFS